MYDVVNNWATIVINVSGKMYERPDSQLLTSALRFPKFHFDFNFHHSKQS